MFTAHDPETSSIVVIFPLISSLVSLACVAIIARDAKRRPRPDKIAWGIAFLIFTIAAGLEVLGDLWKWTPFMARLYYLAGAVLVVGYLALGELYLLAGRKIGRFAPGVTILATALAAAIIFGEDVDTARLQADGWQALHRGTGASALALIFNIGGTLVLVGGVLYSAWHFWKLRIQRHRMIGCILIAVGTLLVGAGGSLTRLGHREYLYIAMAAGIVVIFAGYLETRRPDPHRVAVPAAPGSVPLPNTAVATNGSVNGTSHQAPIAATASAATNHHAGLNGDGAGPISDPGLAYIEHELLPLDDAALAETCRVWSASGRPDADCFSRTEARRVWAFRLRLSPAARTAFDAHSVPVRLQLTELYHEVLTPGTIAAGEKFAAAASGPQIPEPAADVG